MGLKNWKTKRTTTGNSSNNIVDLNLSDETLKELKIWKLVQTTMKLSLEDEIYKQEILVYMKRSYIFWNNYCRSRQDI